MKAIVLFGSPGSGKGTQANFLTQCLKVPHVSTGDMLRDRIRQGVARSAVVATMQSGALVSDDVVGALHETLDLAKKRAVESTQLDNTPYAPLLPATTMAVTLYAISIGTSLSVANGALRNLGAAFDA